MSKKSKLLAALDAHKGRDYEAEKRAKKVKAAEKKKAQKNQFVDVEKDSNKDVDDGIPSAKGSRTGGKQDQRPAPPLEESFANLSDDDDDEDEDEVRPDKQNISGGIGSPAFAEAELESEAEVEDESDVPLSDLSSEDLADTIPHQRLTINNTAALLASTKRVSVIHNPKMTFSSHNSLILTSLPSASISISDANDDLTRELEFYRICRTAAMDARKILKKENVPFTRPADYFAEMVKSDEQMGRVKKKLYDEAANKKAAAEARKLRDAKKFGKAVQVAKEQERAKEKKQVLEKISSLKRKRKGQDTGTVTEGDDLFENIGIDNSTKTSTNNPRGKSSDRRKASSSSTKTTPAEGSASNNDNDNNNNFKRQKRDQKFGFGGKKRFSKSGDAVSTADMRGFSSSRKMKAGAGGGGGDRRGGAAGAGAGAKREKSKRLGKSRRTATGASGGGSGGGRR